MKGSDLNAKQHRFCIEYLKDLNATQAAIRAGYSKNGAGQTAGNLLKKTEIKNVIRDKTAKVAEKTEVTVGWVVENLVKLSSTAKNESVRLGAVEFLGKWQGMLKDKGDQPQVIIQAPDFKRAKPNG